MANPQTSPPSAVRTVWSSARAWFERHRTALFARNPDRESFDAWYQRYRAEHSPENPERESNEVFLKRYRAERAAVEQRMVELGYLDPQRPTAAEVDANLKRWRVERAAEERRLVDLGYYDAPPAPSAGDDPRADRGYRDDFTRSLDGQPAVDSPSRYHDKFAETAISLMDRGTAPWMHNDRRVSEVQPRNAVTGRAYTGATAVYLASRGTHRGFEDNRWLTRDQIEKAGGHPPIGPGERILVRDNSSHQESALQTSVVYNVEQVEGLRLGPQDTRGEVESLRRARAVVLASEVKMLTSPSGNQSYYNAQHDAVVVPRHRHFRSPEHFYSTALRNMAHASGHESRMNRATFREALKAGPGSPAHAREMLRVEIAAMTLCNRLGGDYEPSSDSTNTKLWIQALKEEPREMHRAASEGDRIAENLIRPARDQIEHIDRETRAGLEAYYVRNAETGERAPAPPSPVPHRQAPAMSPER